jgi:hypothetical protein
VQNVIRLLSAEGQSPIVSSLEAFNETASVTSSFIPIIYVDQPEKVAHLVPATKTSGQIMFLLKTTLAVKQQARCISNTSMVGPVWALLDAMASPGRQADATMEILGQKSLLVA